MKRYFTPAEISLWTVSVLCITISFLLFGAKNYLSLAASLVGVTSLVLNAKGNPAGQALMIVFSMMYGCISWTTRYYGEMITYLGMTLPMAVMALISWLRNPFRGKKSEVAANRLPGKEIPFMLLLTGAVTIAFYFILDTLHTDNLIPGTLSVATSFLAVYLTFRRSPWYAAAYAANDIILIILWAIAAAKDSSYLSVLVCFAMFLVNDLYGFRSWIKMGERQAQAA